LKEGGVNGRDNQQDADRTKQQQRRTADGTCVVLLQIFDKNPGPLRFIGKLTIELGLQSGEVGFGLVDADAVLEAADYGHWRRRGGTIALVVVGDHCPHVGFESAVENAQGKPGRQDAQNPKWISVQLDRATHNIARAMKPRDPQRMTDDARRLAVFILPLK